MPAIDKENLKKQVTQVEFNMLDIQKINFVKVYVNDELKVNRENFQTSKHSHTHVKYANCIFTS